MYEPTRAASLGLAGRYINIAGDLLGHRIACQVYFNKFEKHPIKYDKMHAIKCPLLASNFSYTEISFTLTLPYTNGSAANRGMKTQ